MAIAKLKKTASDVVVVADKIYATFDPNYMGANWTLSNGNLTAVKNTATGYTSIYLNQGKTSGKYAIELTLDYAGQSNNAGLIGLANPRTPTNTVGGFVNSVANYLFNAQRYVNNSITNNFFKNMNGLRNVKLLMVIDYDLRAAYFLNYAGTALVPTFLPVERGSLIYAGVTWGTTTVSNTITLNSGQAPFSDANEALLVALEASTGATYKRGLWRDKPAPITSDPRDAFTNLIQDPLNFTAASWTKGDVSVTGDRTIVAPDGTTTASQVKSLAGNGVLRAAILNSMVDGKYSFSVYLKKGRATADSVSLAMLYQGGNYHFTGSYRHVELDDEWQFVEIEFDKCSYHAATYLFALGYGNFFPAPEEVHIWKPVLYLKKSVPELIAHYPLTADANDISGKGNHGTIVDAPSFTAGGAVFNGSTNRIMLPDVFDSIRSGTIMFDLKVSAAGFLPIIGPWISAAMGNASSGYSQSGSILIGEATANLTNESILLHSYNTPATSYVTQGKNFTYVPYGNHFLSDNVKRRIAIVVFPTGDAIIYINGMAVSTSVGQKVADTFLNNGHPNFQGLALGMRRIESNGSVLLQAPGISFTFGNLKIYDMPVTDLAVLSGGIIDPYVCQYRGTISGSNVVDSSNRYPLAITGSLTSSAGGNIGNCLQFADADGIYAESAGDFVELKSVSYFEIEFDVLGIGTLSTNTLTVISKGSVGQYCFVIQMTPSTGSVYISVEANKTIYNGSNVLYQSLGALSTTVWRHYRIVFDGSIATPTNRIMLQVDGVTRTQTSTNANIPAVTTDSTAKLKIGQTTLGLRNLKVDNITVRTTPAGSEVI